MELLFVIGTLTTYFKALRNKKGQKFNIYVNGELKVAIYTPDDWN